MLRASKSLHRTGIHSRCFVSYTLPSIRLLDSFAGSGTGLSGLFSAKTVDDLWFQRGQGLVDTLNGEIFKQKVENAPANLDDLIRVTYAQPDLQRLFTSASLLHNLQFFLETLKACDARQVARADVSALVRTPAIGVRVENAPQNDALAEWVADRFGSVVEFKTLLLNLAAGIKGDGTTWLVAQATYSESATRDGTSSGTTFDTLAIINTYNAGIVDDSIRSGQLTKMKHQKLVREEAVARRESERKELVECKELGGDRQETNTLGSVEEAEEAMLFSDRKLVPVLAIDTSMRTYLQDYGVYGKRDYLENVWHCIDWDVVASRLPPRFKPSMVFEY
ncbi:hypothetical protein METBISCDRAFT_14593 [Metschnikowia bicuspidata]|uniref:Manganese/iron superoxide dismutase C-terminal domain-containing protein n=1 Tax=Metschnikowia bicuspidata TaxID=27322 RepID=A0A4P9ZGL4_9ASCO|nr:hypothetical protein METBISCDRAFT_14593 [Metschnikowia bicuspidata]